jgi:hypothetical protein
LLSLLETLDPLLSGILLFFVKLIVPNGGAKNEGEVLVEYPVDGTGERCLGVKEVQLFGCHRWTVIVYADRF